MSVTIKPKRGSGSPAGSLETNEIAMDTAAQTIYVSTTGSDAIVLANKYDDADAVAAIEAADDIVIDIKNGGSVEVGSGPLGGPVTGTSSISKTFVATGGAYITDFTTTSSAGGGSNVSGINLVTDWTGADPKGMGGIWGFWDANNSRHELRLHTFTDVDSPDYSSGSSNMLNLIRYQSGNYLEMRYNDTNALKFEEAGTVLFDLDKTFKVSTDSGFQVDANMFIESGHFINLQGNYISSYTGSGPSSVNSPVKIVRNSSTQEGGGFAAEFVVDIKNGATPDGATNEFTLGFVDATAGDYPVGAFTSRYHTTEGNSFALTLEKQDTSVETLTVREDSVEASVPFRMTSFSTEPTGTDGTIIYDTDDDLLKVYAGAWAKIPHSDKPFQLPSYQTSELSGLTGYDEGTLIYVQDGDAGSKCLAVFDGVNWKVVAMGATCSAT